MSNQVIDSYRFGGATLVYESTTYINNDDNSDMQDIYNIRYANGCAIVSGSSLIGAKPTQMLVKMSVNGNPTGTMEGRIYSSATYYGGLGTLEETSSTTYDVSTFTTGDLVTFAFSGTYALPANSAICVWYDNSSGDIANSCALRGYYSRTTDNAVQEQCEYNTTESWYRENRYNTWFRMEYVL